MNTIILGLVNSYRLNDRINSFNNSRIKFTKLNHLIERVKIYNEENFNYEIITIQLKKNGN